MSLLGKLRTEKNIWNITKGLKELIYKKKQEAGVRKKRDFITSLGQMDIDQITLINQVKTVLYFCLNY